MKSILIIYPGFPHYRDGIIEELINSKNATYVFAGDKKGYTTIKPFDFRNSDRFYNFPSYTLGPLYFNKGLIRFVLTNKFEGAIVHSSPYWISIIVATLLLRIKGIPVYNWTHGILNDARDVKNWLYSNFYKFFFNGLLVYGNISRNNLIKLGHNPEKVKVIYNSLNYKNQLALRDTLGIKEKNEIKNSLFKDPHLKQLIFIGRLTAQKKLYMLIDALRLLKDENILANLLFVGDGDEKKGLQAYIENLKLEDQVCFYGASYDEDTNYKLIACSDCCVAPGEIGLTAMHALMYGVPVISHNDANNQMPEFEAIVPGVNGALFNNNDVIDLKEKIIQVFEMSEAKPKSEINRDCYKIIDEVYNPKYQIDLIDGLFGKMAAKKF